MYKKFFITIVTSTVFILFIIASVVFYLDPYLHYHLPFSNNNIIYLNQTYQNNGFIRLLNYDSAIIGTSMSEQFNGEEYNELFNRKSVKLIQSGGHVRDLKLLIEKVCENGKANTILVGVDTNLLFKAYGKTRLEIPDYLYNDNALDDAKYLLNKDVLMSEIPKYLDENIKGKSLNLNTAYLRGLSDYSTENTIKAYYDLDLQPMDESVVNSMKQEARKNIDDLITIIKENNEVDFDIMIPPYSILYWKSKMDTNQLKMILDVQKYEIEQFLSLENVSIYYFMDDYDTITNLELYRDVGHYNKNVNTKMLHNMYAGEYLMDEYNYESRLNKMYDFVLNYDYSSFLENY